MASGVARVLKRFHYPLQVILVCVRWYVAYLLGLGDLEEMMAERGIPVDHSTLHRRVIKLMPLLEKMFRKHKRPVGKRWQRAGTYLRIKRQWTYLQRAVDKPGNTIDFLLRAHRDKLAARRFFEKAIGQNSAPQTVNMDMSGANLAALQAIKRRTRPIPGFKDFRCMHIILGGIEVMHMIRKGHMKFAEWTSASAAQQFYSLAS